MWEFDHKESWAPKNWCFWTVVLEKTPASPLNCKEIKPVNPKGNQSWIFIGRTDAEAETELPMLCPPVVKNWLIGKYPDTGGKMKAGREGDDREWESWMASSTQRTWVWASSRSWWWTGKPDVLQSMGSQSVGHDWANELSNIFAINLGYDQEFMYTDFFCFSSFGFPSSLFIFPSSPNPFPTPVETIYLRSGLELMCWCLNPAKTQATWFQDLMKLGFLMSHHRKNSVRDTSDR